MVSVGRALTVRLPLVLSIAVFACMSTVRAEDPRPDGPVDKVLSRQGDITGVGESNVLTFHVSGSSMKAPFKWELSITNAQGKVIHHVVRDDTGINEFFGDQGYVAHCSGYLECKAQYYFHDVPEGIFAGLKPTTVAWKLDEFRLKNLQDTAGTFLRERHVPAEQVSAATAQMARVLSSPPFHVLQVPVSPVQADSPMVWVANVGEFVPFYQE
jgi:hypothetical protein